MPGTHRLFVISQMLQTEHNSVLEFVDLSMTCVSEIEEELAVLEAAMEVFIFARLRCAV